MPGPVLLLVLGILLMEATTEHVVWVQGDSPEESSLSHRRQLLRSGAEERSEEFSSSR